MAKVGIHDRAPGARLFTGPCASPSDRDALTYLRASGASAISITTNHDGTASVRVDADRTAAAAWWLPADQASEVVRRTRATAGARPDTDALTVALMRTATELRVSLTPHETAVQRAREGVRRLNTVLEGLRRSGKLQAFNQAYAAHRKSAFVQGRGFMSYGHAMARLRLALIPVLTGRRPVPLEGLFAEVFR